MGSQRKVKGQFTSEYTGAHASFSGSSTSDVRKKGQAWQAQQESIYRKQLLKAQQDIATSADRAAVRAQEALLSEQNRTAELSRASAVERARSGRGTSRSLLGNSQQANINLKSLLGG